MVGWLQEIRVDSLQAVLTRQQSYGMCKLVSNCSPSILIPLQGLLTFPSVISLQLSPLTHSWNWLQQSMSNALLKIPKTVSNLFLYLSANVPTANANIPMLLCSIQRLGNLCLSWRALKEESIEPFGDPLTEPLSVPEKTLSFVFGILRSAFLFPIFILQTLGSH